MNNLKSNEQECKKILIGGWLIGANGAITN